MVPFQGTVITCTSLLDDKPFGTRLTFFWHSFIIFTRCFLHTSGSPAYGSFRTPPTTSLNG